MTTGDGIGIFGVWLAVGLTVISASEYLMPIGLMALAATIIIKIL